MTGVCPQLRPPLSSIEAQLVTGRPGTSDTQYIKNNTRPWQKGVILLKKMKFQEKVYYVFKSILSLD